MCPYETHRGVSTSPSEGSPGCTWYPLGNGTRLSADGQQNCRTQKLQCSVASHQEVLGPRVAVAITLHTPKTNFTSLKLGTCAKF